MWKEQTRRRMLLSLFLISVIAPAAMGQASDQQNGTAQTNTMCPVLTDEPVVANQWVDFQGKRVYLCCGKCKRIFQQDPQKYVTNLPQFQVVHTASTPAAHAGDDHTHNTPETSEQSVHEHGHEEEHDLGARRAIAATADHAHGEEEPAADATDEHDHSAHEHAGEQGFAGAVITWMGKFHPASINFPVGLMLSAALAELLLIATGRPLFEAAARFCVWVGSLSTVGAALLGWFFAGFRWTDPQWIMTLHRWLGTSAAVWALIVLALCVAAHRSNEKSGRRMLWYRAALFFGAAAIAVNGFFGGAMIYGLDHYAW